MRSILGVPSILVQNMLFEHILQVILEQDCCAQRYGFVPDEMSLIEDYYSTDNLTVKQVKTLHVDWLLVRQALQHAIMETIGEEINIVNYDLACTDLLIITTDL